MPQLKAGQVWSSESRRRGGGRHQSAWRRDRTSEEHCWWFSGAAPSHYCRWMQQIFGGRPRHTRLWCSAKSPVHKDTDPSFFFFFIFKIPSNICSQWEWSPGRRVWLISVDDAVKLLLFFLWPHSSWRWRLFNIMSFSLFVCVVANPHYSADWGCGGSIS